MGVTPRMLVARPDHVPVGYVHAPYVSCLAVYDHYLAVIAPVHAVGKLRERHPEERMRVYPRRTQAGEETAPRRERAHIVVDHLHLHTLTGFRHKYVGYLMADVVVKEYVVLQEYRLPGREQVTLEGGKFVFPPGEDLHAVVHRIERRRKVAGKLYQVSLRPGEVLRVKVHMARRHRGDHLPLVVARDHMLPAQAPAEEDIEHKAAHRQEDEGHQPREAPNRVTVLAQYHDYARHHHHDVYHIRRVDPYVVQADAPHIPLF